MTATAWSHMEAGPHRGTRGEKGPRARLFNTLQQIVVDEYKRQDRRFRWVRFADASKQQIEALFSWRESLDNWHLRDFDQEAFEVIQAADNAWSAYVPRRVYEAPTHTEPIALHSRRIGAIQPPPPKAAPKVIFGSKPRNFLVQLLRYRQKQIFQGNHRLEQGLLLGLRVHSGTRRLREV